MKMTARLINQLFYIFTKFSCMFACSETDSVRKYRVFDSPLPGYRYPVGYNAPSNVSRDSTESRQAELLRDYMLQVCIGRLDMEKYSVIILG